MVQKKKNDCQGIFSFTLLQGEGALLLDKIEWRYVCEVLEAYDIS